MSRFNPYIDETLFERVRPPRTLLLLRPAAFAAMVGLLMLTVAGLALLTIASMAHPMLALRVEPLLTVAIGSLIFAFLASPLFKEGIAPSGVALRGFLGFMLVGVSAPAIGVVFEWSDSGLTTSLRLASLFADAMPAIAASTVLHAAIGLFIAPVCALFVCRFDR